MHRYAAILLGCLASSLVSAAEGMTEALLDAEQGLENWTRIGDANWHAEDGAIVANKGKGASFMVSRKSYGNFHFRAEVWIDPQSNSGVFIRATDPSTVNTQTSYEVNLFDNCGQPANCTGGIVNTVPATVVVNAGGKWNVLEITARGPRLTVSVNGVETASGEDSRFLSDGRIALQYRGGPEGEFLGAVKWRKVEITELQ